MTTLRWPMSMKTMMVMMTYILKRFMLKPDFKFFISKLAVPFDGKTIEF